MVLRISFACMMFGATVLVAQQPAAAVDPMQAAETALEHGQFEQAATLLKAIVADAPKNAQALYDLGFAEEHIQHDDAAAKAYQQAMAADPTMPEPALALGLLDAREGRSLKAHTELEGVAGSTNASPQLRARALRAMARIDADTNQKLAADELLQAIQLAGEAPGDHNLSARLAEAGGDAEGAEREYRAALIAQPDDVDAAVGLARALRALNRLAEAEGVLTSQQTANPASAQDPRLIAQLAAIYVREEKDAQAIPLLESLRAGNPASASDPILTEMLARIYAMHGRETEAEALYRQLLVKQPDNPALLDALGGVLVRQNRSADAIPLLRKAVAERTAFQDDKAWADAADHLAFAASQAHDPQLCLDALAQRATVLPNSAPSLFLSATAHDALHQNKQAIVDYRAFLTAAGGKFPNEEFEARHRIVALERER